MIEDTKLLPVITVAAGAAGTSAITGSTIDLTDAEGVLFIINTGPIVTGAVTSVKFMEGATTSPATDVTGTSITIADDDDNEVFYLNIKRPGLRYGTLYVSRATQNATVVANALVYGVRSKPTTQAAGVTGETHLGAIAGTA